MDNFITIEIFTDASNAFTKNMYGYNTLNEAIASYHGCMYRAMSNENCETCLVKIIDKFGNTMEPYNTKYYAHEPEPEPTPEMIA